MKNILVPTDFSPCANNATDAAVSLARRCGAKVHLLNSQDLPPYWDSLPKKEQSKWASVSKPAAVASSQLLQLKKKYPGTEVFTATSSANLPEAVKKYITGHGIDLVVMGSHGAKGKNEFFIGSNTQKVVRTIHCPCLVLKHGLKTVDFRKVVFASSFLPSEMESFLYFKNFIKKFIPEIHLVAICTSIFDAPRPIQLEAMKPFEKACAPLVCHSHVYKDISIDKGTRSFAQDIGADLVAISYHDRHPLKRMLVGSNVEAIVNHSALPVLTIDF